MTPNFTWLTDDPREMTRETIFIEEMTVSLLAESFNIAIIDSGFTKTVCG